MPELRVVITVVALLAAMLISGAIGWRQRSGILVLALLSFVWLTLDQNFEGGVLISLTSHNGITASDLVGITGLIVGVLLWLRLRRR
jgi:hypothetical protein